MNMAFTKNKSLAMIAFSAVFVLLGFQNCSKVGVMDTSSGSDKVSGDGLVAGNPDGGSGSASDPNGDGSPSNPDGSGTTGNPGGSTSNPDGSGTVGHPGDGGTDVAHNPPGGSGGNSGPGGGHEGDNDDHGDHHQAQPSNPDDIRASLIKLCMNAKGGPLAGPVIRATSGHLIVESDNIQDVQLTSGLLLVKGKSDKSHAVHIGTTDAPIVVCGMDVDEIETTAGDVTLVNCHVRKRLTMTKAKLTTYHSSVEGNFDATDTEIVNVDED
jgi:hypothetical protein